MKYKHKIVHLLVTLLALFANFSFHDATIGYTQAQAQSSGFESYSQRPDVLKIKAQNHKLGVDWNDLKASHFSFVAQLLAIYPKDVDLYFLARDSELLYDTARLATQNTPDAQRIHLLNISRANMNDPLVVNYLAQNGISEASLAKGKKVLFVDTGFSGTIPRVISTYFPAQYHAQLKTHLIVSSNLAHPSSRSFLYYLNPMILNLAPAEMHGTIVNYEHMPRYTDRSHEFQSISGKIEAISSTTNSTDGSVSKPQSLQYMQDIKAEWQRPSVQQRFQIELDHNKRLLKWMTDGTQASAEQLNQLFVDESEDAKRSRILVFDILDAQKNLNLQFKTPIPKIIELAKLADSDKSGYSKKNFIIENQPELAPILQDPETQIPKLLKQKQWKTLGILIDANVDKEINQILIDVLFEKPATGFVRTLQSTIIEKDNYDLNQYIIEHVLNNDNMPYVSKMSYVAMEIVKTTKQKQTLRHITEVLKNFSQQDAREIVEYLIKNNPMTGKYGVHYELVISYFTHENSYDNEDLLIKIIQLKNKDVNQAIVENCFRSPQSFRLGQSLQMLIDLMNKNDYEHLIRHVFEAKNHANHFELLKIIVETKLGFTQWDIAHSLKYTHFTLPGYEPLKILHDAAALTSLKQRKEYLEKHWSNNAKKSLPPAQAESLVKPKVKMAEIPAEPKAKVETTVAITEKLVPGQQVVIGKKKYTVLASAGQGRRGVVFKVMDSQEQIFALKVAKSNDPENLKSVQGESEKEVDWKKTGVDHSQVVYQGETFALKTWVEGISGEDVMKSYNSGDKKYEKAVLAIQSLMAKLAKNGVYIGDFRPPNLIWTGKKWVLVDSGSVKVGLSQVEALQKWQATDVKGDKVSRRWGSEVASALQCIKVIAK